MGRARRSAASVAEAATEAEAEHEPEAGPEANGQDADSASSTPPAPLKKRGRARQPPQQKADDEGGADDEDDGEDDDEEYEVEQILDSKKVKGKTHFLIRWKGYQPESDTWEPESTLNCPDLIGKFKESQTNGKKKKSGPKRTSKKEFDYENADENAEYEVDKILEVHHKKNGSREFLIHWKGWAASHDTWEPEDNLCCPELMKRFMSKVKAKTTATPRDLRVAPSITKRFTLSSKDSGRRLSKRSNNRQRVRYDDAE